jgi:hypothetical protein
MRRGISPFRYGRAQIILTPRECGLPIDTAAIRVSDLPRRLAGDLGFMDIPARGVEDA